MSKYLLLSLAVSAFLQAQPVTFATCSVGETTITSSTSCTIQFPTSPFSGGEVDAEAQVTGSPGSVNAEASGGATADPGVPWYANARASETDYYSTAGPVRQGYISLVEDAFGGLAQVSVGSFHGDISGMFEFELGTTPFIAQVGAGAGGAGDPASGGRSSAGYNFTLYEADGKTPVPLLVLAAPEPLMPATCWAALE
jgi:hypothetical protein